MLKSRPLQFLLVAGIGFWAGRKSTQDPDLRAKFERKIPAAGEATDKVEALLKTESAELLDQAQDFYTKTKDETLPKVWEAAKAYLKKQQEEAERTAKSTKKESQDF